jgi:hypothetical protein
MCQVQALDRTQAELPFHLCRHWTSRQVLFDPLQSTHQQRATLAQILLECTPLTRIKDLLQ